MLRTSLILAAVLVSTVLPAAAEDAARPLERVFYDGVDRDGKLTGGFLMLDRPEIDRDGPGLGLRSTTIIDNGPPANRIDLVCVGDGYVEDELGLYAGHVTTSMAGFFAGEPYRTYATLFNVHQVDVVSNESGVDNDPTPGIERDTALDMGFWCSGIERLLCVNVSAAYAHANTAPDVDQVFAIANSTKYGGAGYTSSELATFSGGNSAAVELALHELGHSLGNLADEYDYGDGAVYTGGEPYERNVSIHDAPAMELLGAKWASWLGYADAAYDGLIDTYEGAYYCRYGIYRPTANSKMRSLGRPFNLPSIEGLVIEFYRIVDPIDDHTPNDVAVGGDDIVRVDPIDPVGHPLSVQWFVDGVALAGAVADTVDLSAYNVAAGLHTLTVTVVDQTDFVRDEAARDEFMTQTVAWTLFVDTSTAVEDVAAAGVARFENVPNPFNPRTAISFELPQTSNVSVRIYDVQGRLVKELVAMRSLAAGTHRIIWDGDDDHGSSVASGTYVCQLRVGDHGANRLLSLVR